MKTLFCCLAAILLTATNAVAASSDPKPLFSSDDVIQLRIEAPFKELIKRAPDAKDPFPATLILGGAQAETHSITLLPRGRSRRNPEICGFPPLRIAFNEKPGDASLFDGQKRLKLVTHCRKTSSFQQKVLLEYTAYRLFNLMTPASLKVRLAEIEYYDSQKDKSVIERVGFLIEDTDDAAKRNGVKEIDVEDIAVSQLDPIAAGRFAVFQYMISNYDWSMHDAGTGDDCCHNAKLIGARTQPYANLTPVAYDFDHSGLVDTPYAAVPPMVPVRNVRMRHYRGVCTHNAAARQAAADVRGKENAVMGLIDQIPGLKNTTKSSTKQFLNRFFKDIEDDESVEKNLLSDCRS